MTALGLWSANSQIGKTLLHGLGDVAAQTRILGAEYHWVYGRIHGVPDSSLPPTALANARQTLNTHKRVAPNIPPGAMPSPKRARRS